MGATKITGMNVMMTKIPLDSIHKEPPFTGALAL